MKSYLFIFLLLLSGFSLLAQAPTISSLTVTGDNIKWYNASTGGTQYTSPETTNLVNGQIYYASQTVNGCESTVRLAVTATLTTVATPVAGTHVAAQTQIEWKWAAVSGATGYKWNTENIYSGATDLGNVLTKTETGLTCNTAETSYLWAYNGSCVSAVATLTQTTSACASAALTYDYTGAMQSFTVPTGVNSITFEAWGAQGWSGTNSGGLGGYATGTLAVTQGQTVYVFVGGQGTVANLTATPMGAGWNGGGNGQNNSVSSAAGGGGGASDIRFGGTALADRKLVAAGGGGSTNNGSCYGGSGGGLSGSKGGGGYDGGFGGTPTEGGSFGGTLGQGGNALVSYMPWNGGGGGGYYGGGTSSAHGSGGGGSSYIGGVTSGSTTAGQKSGNGQIKITYNVVAGTSWTFTNASATGRTGPTQGQVDAAYTGTSLAGGVTINTQGIQEWTVPVTGSYSIRASGAQGARSGGLGADMTGTFSLTQGEIIKIVVGQTGVNGISSDYLGGGGGGGTFVIRTPYSNNASILVIGGGGGGYTNYGTTTVMNAFSTTSGGSTNADGGGTSGNGGNYGADGGAAGGGGFLTDGANGVNITIPYGGKAFVNGTNGGAEGHDASFNGGDGGFGGGGAGWSNVYNRSGGGGGYSGGQGGGWVGQPSGGGGGSYNAGTNQTNTAASRSGHGQVIITKL